MDNITQKKCIECGETKPISEFKRDGIFLSTACQECRSTWIELPYATQSEMHAEATNNQRAKRHSCEGVLTIYDWIDLKNKYNNTCLCCGKQEPEIKLTRDHIVPLTLGGKNTVDNIQPLCKPCNSRKKQGVFDYRVQKHDWV